jgi:cytochrome c oxidase assembly protein subunit 15
MDAGHAYNTFPLMGGRLIPEEYWTIPGWRNAFENTAAVQFHHRVLATTTLSAVVGTWLVHRGAHLPPSTRGLLLGVVALTAVQVCPHILPMR